MEGNGSKVGGDEGEGGSRIFKVFNADVSFMFVVRHGAEFLELMEKVFNFFGRVQQRRSQVVEEEVLQ